jgi:hypothetical protein
MRAVFAGIIKSRQHSPSCHLDFRVLFEGASARC